MTLNVDFLRQLASLDGILAGFSLATAVRLINDKARSAVATFTLAALLAATLVLVDCVFLAVIVGSRAPAQAAMPSSDLSRLVDLAGIDTYLSLAGLLIFFVGTTLAAWLWSKLIGILVSVIGFISVAGAIVAWVMLP